MFDEKKLWRDRAGARVKELARYLKYIFNGHIVIVMLFLIGTAAYYYQQWIATLPADFPAELITATVIGIFLTGSPVYNFLLEADRVFLIPLETKLKGYFLRSGLASIAFQGYILLMVLAVFMPLYAHVNPNGFHLFLPIFIVLLVIKAWNVAVGWRIDFFVQPSVHRWDMTVRLLMNIIFAYLLLVQASFYIILMLGLIMVAYYGFFHVRTSTLGLKWDLLIDHEQKRMASFYRLANLFTDVPHLKETVKRRKWLDFLLRGVEFSQENTYLYLYSRTFLRSSDYLGLFIRLTVIGTLAIYFISFGIGQIILLVLFLYLTGFQLQPLIHHHQNKLWVDLYPSADKTKWAAFAKLILVVMSVQLIVFAVMILIKGEILLAIGGFAAGLVFNYLFVHVYSKKRLKL
ncbi:ABC transporter permease [Neobacillus sp. Marseille-QA0830]